MEYADIIVTEVESCGNGEYRGKGWLVEDGRSTDSFARFKLKVPEDCQEPKKGELIKWNRHSK